MSQAVHVVGVGMAPFSKPSAGRTYDQMGVEAARAALTDAGIEYARVKQAFVGYVYGDSASGQNTLYGLGLTGIPIINVNNQCASGSTALWQATQAVASGAVDCVLALGFEQMPPGAVDLKWNDRPSSLARGIETINRSGDDELNDAPVAIKVFGRAAIAHAKKYGTQASTLAKITVKARAHAANNPNAVFRTPVTVEEVLASPRLGGPLTRLQACPPTSGAAAAVLCSAEFAARHGVRTGVVIAGQSLRTDGVESFSGSDALSILGGGPGGIVSRTAHDAYGLAGIEAKDIDVVELHDCFTINELVAYESLYLTPEGTAGRFVEDGENTYGGRVVVNPSGGLLAKGHPLGATGLAQCAEIVWQLRGQAGARQVERARIGVSQNAGLGGACVVTVYKQAGV